MRHVSNHVFECVFETVSCVRIAISYAMTGETVAGTKPPRRSRFGVAPGDWQELAVLPSSQDTLCYARRTFVPCVQPLGCGALSAILILLVALQIFIGATSEKWKEVVSMTASWITIFAAIGLNPLGEWLHRGNERRAAVSF